MKKERVAEAFLAQLRKVPIVQVACEKAGVARNSVYRWRNEDPEFSKAMDEAMAEGEAIMNDLSESQLLTMIKDYKWQAIAFWLSRRNPKFKSKLEVTSRVEPREGLTPEEEEMWMKALKYANGAPEEQHEE